MKAMPRNRSIWVRLTTQSVALTVRASAQQPPEARIQELIRVAAERAATGQGAAPGQAPTVLTPSAPDTRPVVRLGLEEAVKLTLEKNLDIAVQRLNPQINDIALASLRSVYHPSLTSQVQTQSTTQAATSTIAGGTSAGQAVVNDQTVYNGGIAQSIPWGGGAVAVQLNNNRSSTTSANSLFNPSYNTNWSGQYTQPLLRGFKTDTTRQQIDVARINRDISDVQLRSSLTNTLSNVRNAYWDYVFAVQSV